MSGPFRLPADAAHNFGGIDIDRGKPLHFRLDGRRIEGFAGDTVLSAALAAGIATVGTFGKTSLGLTDRFAPLVSRRGNAAMPIDRLPAADGTAWASLGPRRLGIHARGTLGHRIDGVPESPWLRHAPTRTIEADVLVVGAGVAGLAAAEAAARRGSSVLLVERRPWAGGDARYFGPVGDEVSPEAATGDLIQRVASHSAITLLLCAEVFSLLGSTARVHRIVDGGSELVAVAARRVVLATGTLQRLPVFAGNRLPGVFGAMSAYHLAKRFGVAPGRSAVVATQSNYGYRLALRLRDAGVDVRRVIDPRVNAQSRFVDFAKASGLTLSGGHYPIAAAMGRAGLHLSFAAAGTNSPSLTLDADSLVVAGGHYPDLHLWMLAGGGTRFEDGRLIARGVVEHTALAGAAAGYRSLGACIASGAAVVEQLFGGTPAPIEDREIGALHETPPVAMPFGPPAPGEPAFYDAGVSLIARPVPNVRPLLSANAQAPSLGDVAASVELGYVAAADAGAVAEERGAPGADLVAGSWAPAAEPAADETPPWLTARLGETVDVHLVVDGKRRFARGALVYANSSTADSILAIGVIVREAPSGQPGGHAVISRAALRRHDRFIVETLDGPSPARIRANDG